jgi:hypothetical protein
MIIYKCDRCTNQELDTDIHTWTIHNPLTGEKLLLCQDCKDKYDKQEQLMRQNLSDWLKNHASS